MKFIFVSNLYPSNDFPFKGSFVKNIYIGFKRMDCDTGIIKLKDENVRFISKLWNYFIFYCKMFISAIKANEKDVYYVHYISHSSLGLIIASLFKSKNSLRIISNVHGSDILPESYGLSFKIKMYIAKYTLSLSEIVVAPSNYFKSILIRDYNVCKKKIIVSPSGGVDSSIFTNTNTNKGKKKVYVWLCW